MEHSLSVGGAGYSWPLAYVGQQPSQAPSREQTVPASALSGVVERAQQSVVRIVGNVEAQINQPVNSQSAALVGRVVNKKTDDGKKLLYVRGVVLNIPHNEEGVL